MNPWFILIIAGLFEVCWAVGLKQSDGFKNNWWTTFTIITLIISMTMLSQALKDLPVGTGYAVWTGIGAVGTAILGMIIFKESSEFWRLFFIGLIVVGIVGLKFVTK
ncbi:MAG: multidrug efflux SMR transporter [Bacteroidetes bacterium]|nr:multidrug efflux SMR transporter [Bacteroidota bacterium]